jgi:hypothetical protein
MQGKDVECGNFWRRSETEALDGHVLIVETNFVVVEFNKGVL